MGTLRIPRGYHTATRARLAGRRKDAATGMPSFETTKVQHGGGGHREGGDQGGGEGEKKRERWLELKAEKERAAEADRVAALYDLS